MSQLRLRLHSEVVNCHITLQSHVLQRTDPPVDFGHNILVLAVFLSNLWLFMPISFDYKHALLVLMIITMVLLSINNTGIYLCSERTSKMKLILVLRCLKHLLIFDTRRIRANKWVGTLFSFGMMP